MRNVLAVFLLAGCAAIASAQVAGEPASAQAPPAGGEVTIKGIMMSTWHFYRHAVNSVESPSGEGRKFDLVIYAFDGPPERR